MAPCIYFVVYSAAVVFLGARFALDNALRRFVCEDIAVSTYCNDHSRNR